MFNTQENTQANTPENNSEQKSALDQIISFMEIALEELKETRRQDAFMTDPELLKQFYNEAYEQGWEAACENVNSSFNPRIEIEEGPFSLDCYLQDYYTGEPTEDMPYVTDTISVDKMMRLVKEIFKINI